MKLRSDREEGGVGFFRYFFQFKHSNFTDRDRPFFYLSRLFWIGCVIGVFVIVYFLYGYIDYRQNTTMDERAANLHQEKVVDCFNPYASMEIAEIEKYCNVDVPDNMEELRSR